MTKLSSQEHASEKPCDLRDRREKNLARLITLLGTYSFNEKEPVVSLRHRRPNDKRAEFSGNHGHLERLLLASSCNTLRGMISRDSRSMSSFPALVLNSFGWGQVIPNAAEKQQVASFFVGRPLVFIPPRRVDMESSVKNNTTPEFCAQNCTNHKKVDKTDVDEKKRAALESNYLVGIKRHKPDADEEEPLALASDLSDHETDAQLDDVDCCAAIQTVEDVARVPFLMMSNFSSSFALLIEARLRAYGNILKRHIATFSHDSQPNPPIYADGDNKSFLASHNGCPISTQMKLNTLVFIGSHMQVSGVVTTFNVQECTPVIYPKNWKNIKSVDDNILTLPIKFEAIVDISIPVYKENAWQLDKGTVSMQTNGTITGCYEEASNFLLSQVHVELDTHTLVSQMISKACEVVLNATQNANAAVSEMKDAPPMSPQCDDQVNLPDVEKSTSSHITDKPTNSMLTSLNQHYTMVTPEFKSRASTSTPSEFTLDGEKGLSAKNPPIDKDCAAIIDYAIGNFHS